ncbi:carbonic anhydrase [Rhabdochromatium marinum]|uniref:carbonic anhydrase n=1 Tax=Rhabdochromatium marinum TaxID=48729 RepID=UPI0019066EF9|nr:carbonic anhydrase family protein [Rhabdochromatium marinum]MBK1649205.1 carbonate dehydratase [Rhabdochromatium marinum]
MYKQHPVSASRLASVCLATLFVLSASPVYSEDGAHWGYEGKIGPAHWGELNPAWHMCGEGHNQSPIDIQGALDADLPPIDWHYSEKVNDEIVNNGHTIQISYKPDNWIFANGHDYQLRQFHFHSPSENHIGGREFPLEAHLVHTDAAGNIAVVAVMFEEGAANPLLQAAWQIMPQEPGTHNPLPARPSAVGLLPKQRDYYRFNGSLTTPPCSEGVLWIVMKQPVTASREQIARFANVMGHPNNRPLQPIYARAVLQ